MTTVTTSTSGVPAPRAADHDDEVLRRRDQRFAEGIRALRTSVASIRFDERLLMILGGALIPLGAIVVLLGWWGAAHSAYVFDQVPYVISGGLLGLGMIFLGAFLYFTHWITQLVQENRQQSAALLAAIDQLQDRLTDGSVGAVRSANGASPREAPADELVATARGTLAHRPDCAVVAGKSALRQVRETDGLAPCKLCGPY